MTLNDGRLFVRLGVTAEWLNDIGDAIELSEIEEDTNEEVNNGIESNDDIVFVEVDSGIWFMLLLLWLFGTNSIAG